MTENLSKWKHYELGIIVLCIRWYLKYPLSYRMLEEMMSERGLNVIHITIMRWVHQYSPILDERIRTQVKKTNDSWRMDETYLKIKGKNAYLYRAVDSDGNTIDFYLSEKRDKNAARKFFEKSVEAHQNQQPRVITTDKYGATEIAILEEIYYGSLSCKTQHQMTKYLNNNIKHDHRFIKRKINPMLGFQSYESAVKTFCGIEIIHMIRKGQVEGIQCVFSEVYVINELLGVIA